MKIIVVDTNILFASLKVKHSLVRKILFDSTDYRFIAPNFSIVEIFKHKERIVSKSKLSEDEILELLTLLLQKIGFINEDLISTENFIYAYRLCNNVDEKDTAFIALTLEFDALLWTYDEKLKSALSNFSALPM